MGLFQFLKYDACIASTELTECNPEEGTFSIAEYADSQCSQLLSYQSSPLSDYYCDIYMPVDYVASGQLSCMV